MSCDAGSPSQSAQSGWALIACALDSAGTPKDVVARLSDAFKQVLALPDVRNRMITQGADPAFLGADDFAKFLAAETPRWADAVKKSGAKLD